MKLWLISQNKNTGYDTFDALVVAARTEDEARRISPVVDDNVWSVGEVWTAPENVSVRLLGTAKPGTKAGMVLGSFHAG